MLYLLVLVLDKDELVGDVMRSWREAGSRGITMLDSTGPGRLMGMLREDMPLMPSLSDLLTQGEAHHRTMFTLLDGEELVEQVAAATERVVGDLNQPHTGIMFCIPVSKAWGNNKAIRPLHETKAPKR